MKKLLSLLCAGLLATSAAVSVSAAGIEDWTAGNGYLVNDKNATTVVTETDKGIQVVHGGYYTDGTNWGGVAYNEKIDLDGFSVEFVIDKLPDTGDDTWISVSFLQKPQLFQVGNYGDNKGISNLLRWKNEDAFQSFGPDGFSQCGNDVNAAFDVKVGDTITVSVAEKSGKYVLTVNGIETSVAYDLSSIAPDGKAYCIISASMKDSPADGFQYTITKVNGQPTVTPDAPAEVDSAAQTSDASVAVAALCLASLAGALIVSKKIRRA